ncbi:FMN-binding domain protein [Thiorhodococcus drewsii AZ1]|uniref:FMN-binding domain protein n=1 Tax=Thiorhodococcus drewsii AZ1 TaxID=765913 RepID=G2E498_9GAMM|nr:FMN-binding protein [Thiorhodococcus drewsii]EGV29825.1 FMN-binding domain protein [Thiorhodococcus drewsii AZ1]
MVELDRFGRRRVVATLLLAAIVAVLWARSEPAGTGPGPAFRIDPIDPAHSVPRLIGQATEVSGVTTGFGVMADSVSTEGHGYALLGAAEPQELSSFGLVGGDDAVQRRPDEVLAELAARAEAGDPDGCSAMAQATETLPIAERRDRAGRFCGLYLDNFGLDSRVRGFAGPLRIGVYFDADGQVRQLVHLESRETPSYLRRVASAGFYERARAVELAPELQRIDAVSGATMTSQALARALDELVVSAGPALDVYLDQAAQGFALEAPLSERWKWQLALIVAMFALVWQRRWRLNRFGLTLLGVASLLTLGFLFNLSFTYLNLLHPLLGVSVSALVACYGVLVLLGAIWDDNTYCRHICPFGQAQRLVARLDRRSRWRRWPLDNRLMSRLRLVLALVLIGGVTYGVERWSGFELFPELFGLDISSIWFLVALFLVLRLSAWVPMVWCRLLCPTGAVLDLVARAVRPGSCRTSVCVAGPQPPLGTLKTS